MYVYIYIYVYLELNYFTVCLPLTQHCKSTILQFKKTKRSKSKPGSNVSHDPLPPHCVLLLTCSELVPAPQPLLFRLQAACHLYQPLLSARTE